MTGIVWTVSRMWWRFCGDTGASDQWGQTMTGAWLVATQILPEFNTRLALVVVVMVGAQATLGVNKLSANRSVPLPCQWGAINKFMWPANVTLQSCRILKNKHGAVIQYSHLIKEQNCHAICVWPLMHDKSKSNSWKKLQPEQPPGGEGRGASAVVGVVSTWGERTNHWQNSQCSHKIKVLLI